jgi:hypothetical protein
MHSATRSQVAISERSVSIFESYPAPGRGKTRSSVDRRRSIPCLPSIRKCAACQKAANATRARGARDDRVKGMTLAYKV